MGVSTSFSKAESEIREQKLKQLFGAGLHSEPLKIADAVPTELGGYVLKDVGAYPNGLTALDKHYNVAFLSSGGWELISVPVTQNRVDVRLFADIPSGDFPLPAKAMAIQNDLLWIVKTGQTALSTDIPSETSTKWKRIAKDLISESSVNPLKWNPENDDLEKISGLGYYTAYPLLGFGYVSNEKTTEERLINMISYAISSKIPNNTVTAKLYAFNSDQGEFSPNLSSAVLLATKVFTNFNSNFYGRAYWFFPDPKLIPKDVNLVLYYESTIVDSLALSRVPGGRVQIRERRVNPTNYFLDLDGNTTDEPVMALLSKKEIADIKKSDLQSKMFLPPMVPAVVGHELCLYSNSFLNLPNNDRYHKRFRNVTYNWSSVTDNYGIKITDNMLSYIPNEAGKVWYFVADILNDDYQIIAQKPFRIETFANTKKWGDGNCYICVVGDSTIQYKQGWVAKAFELMIKSGNMIDDNGVQMNINPVFVGSKLTTTGVLPEVYHEGYEGQTFGFLSGTGSPFYINGEINLQAYAESKGVPRLDELYLQFSINDVGNMSYDVNKTDGSFEALAYAAKAFINKALSADKGFPNMKIVVSFQPNGGLNNGDVASKDVNELKRKMFLAYGFLDKQLSSIPNVEFCYTFLQIDRENSYEYTLVPPNSYDNSGTLIKKYTDPVHYGVVGCKQVAAAFYATHRRINN